MSTTVASPSVLLDAARAALAAPSIFNTQPWIWRTARDTLHLFADRDRQLAAVDPVGRELTISCGTALHHARVALTADGYEVDVHRFPDAARSGNVAQARRGRRSVLGPSQ